MAVRMAHPGVGGQRFPRRNSADQVLAVREPPEPSVPPSSRPPHLHFPSEWEPPVMREAAAVRGAEVAHPEPETERLEPGLVEVEAALEAEW